MLTGNPDFRDHSETYVTENTQNSILLKYKNNAKKRLNPLFSTKLYFNKTEHSFSGKFSKISCVN